MKYIFISIAAIAVVFGISFLVTSLIRKKMKKKPSMFLHIIISIGSGLAVLCIGAVVFINIHYPAQEDALAVFSDTSGARVTEIDGGYLADGPGESAALVFYPGAKVDTEAYLPLMKQIADNGVDCFLLDMPMRMAILDKNAADKIVDCYNYEHWIIGGHSMGGMIAAGYAADNPNTVDGVVLLAAYPTQELSDSIRLLSVYGTEDGVLNRDAYEDAKKYFPQEYTEKIIDGGNHAGFGNYGVQSGDGKATIMANEQQSQTTFAITEFAKSIIV